MSIDSISEEADAGNPNLKRSFRRDRLALDPAKFDRLPPNSKEAEQGVIGCCLWAPSECLDVCAEAFGAAAGEVFYDLRHRMIYDRMQAMHGDKRGIDLITLQAELQKNGELDQVGGITYLSQMQDAVPSAANLSYYSDVVVEKWQWRTFIRMCADISARPYDETNDPSIIELDQAIADMEKTITKIVSLASRSQEVPIKTIIKTQVLPSLEEHYTRGRAQIRGVTTGLEYVDKVLCGMGGKHGNYYVWAARPNVGKTSIATQVSMHVALDWQRWEALSATELAKGLPTDAEGKQLPHKVLEDGATIVLRTGCPVAISSLEMTGEALVQKMLFQRGKADLQRWRTGYAVDGDVKLLTLAAGQLARANNIYVDDTPRLRIGQLKARWRRWYRQYGVRFFILDYLQLMQADSRRGRPDRVQELAEVSAEIQALGKELNCPMVILAQMNRDYEKDPNRAPRMSDLKDCGAVEQDADVIGFLYEPRLSETAQEFYDNAIAEFHAKEMRKAHGDDWRTKVANDKWKLWDGKPQRINVLFAKNRFGPKGKAELLLLHQSTTFVDWGVWLKQNNLRAAAKGESQYDKEEEPAEE